MKEKDDTWISAIFFTPQRTYLHGEVQSYNGGMSLHLFYKDGIKKDKGDIIEIKDVLVDLSEVEEFLP